LCQTLIPGHDLGIGELAHLGICRHLLRRRDIGQTGLISVVQLHHWFQFGTLAI
jgi:hypothetical protein